MLRLNRQNSLKQSLSPLELNLPIPLKVCGYYCFLFLNEHESNSILQMLQMSSLVFPRHPLPWAWRLGTADGLWLLPGRHDLLLSAKETSRSVHYYRLEKLPKVQNHSGLYEVDLNRGYVVLCLSLPVATTTPAVFCLPGLLLVLYQIL